jgi:hypothetical protein
MLFGAIIERGVKYYTKYKNAPRRRAFYLTVAEKTPGIVLESA